MDKKRLNNLIQSIEDADVYDVAIQTQLEKTKKLSKRLGTNLYIKREDLQPVNSFKIRGAYNKISQLSSDQKSKGVLAASAGNHAQGVAISAQRLGIKATIVMPTTTPDIKIQAVRLYGADIILEGDSYSDSALFAEKLQKETKMTFIHPFDDEAVIAGQGTIGKEILEQLPNVDYVFVPIGGGGLIAGVSAYLKFHKPDIKVIGVHPADSTAMKTSIEAGKRVTVPDVGIFADGVAVKYVGKLPFEITRQCVDEIMTVTTDQICAAIKDIYEYARVIAEPAGALAVAGVEKYSADHNLSGKNVVAINSGANMTFERLQFVAERTLLGSGRESLYGIRLPERPGALRGLVNDVIGEHAMSEFNYRKSDDDKAEIFVGLLQKSQEDKAVIEAGLKKFGYEYDDLSNDEISKIHVRHMIGGFPPKGTKETIYEFTFPERPNALSDFLAALKDRYNISLFHYRYTGGDVAHVLLGLEGEGDLSDIELPRNFAMQKVQSKAVDLFL